MQSACTVSRLFALNVWEAGFARIAILDAVPYTGTRQKPLESGRNLVLCIHHFFPKVQLTLEYQCNYYLLKPYVAKPTIALIEFRVYYAMRLPHASHR